VTGFTLSPTFQKVYVSVAIDPQYRNIIRENTRFWNSSGTRFSAGLFSGVQFESESLETVIRGGIALATPEDCGSQVETGRHYHLFDEAEPAWLEWRPNLAESKNER
jgi:paraquat-inducible protein B